MSIATELENYSTYLTNAYNKAEEKGATIPANKNLQNLTDTINSISGQATSVESKDVNFLDSDGTILYSYSATDFANLTELPANPTHSGLISTGWNWTLTDAKNYVATYGFLDIGQTYETSGGVTNIYINLLDDLKALSLCLFLNGTITVDWGDNSATETITEAEDSVVIPHTYAEAGEHKISIKVNSGYATIEPLNAQCDLIAHPSGNTMARYAQAITKIEMGTSIYLQAYALAFSGIKEFVFSSITPLTGYDSIPQYAFYYCQNLKTLIFPNWVKMSGIYAYSYSSIESISFCPSATVINQYTFANCFKIKRIAVPTSCTYSSNYSFRYCRALERIALSNTTSSFGTGALQYCTSLNEIKIPSSITSIANNAFSYCESVLKFDFTQAVSVPTLSNTNAFTGLYSIYNIVVPDSLYDTWISTSYWNNSTIKPHIIKASEI